MDRIAIFISGRGSGLQSIIDAQKKGKIKCQIALVISDNEKALGLSRAKKNDIATRVFLREDYSTKITYEEAILKTLKDYKIDHIILAGFMKILGKTIIQPYENKILNIHPSLLPAFAGLHVHEKVIASGVKYSGCTIHFVDEGMDTGPIISQGVVEVKDDDTPKSLADRVLEVEHSLYPKVIDNYLKGKYRILNRKVIFEDGEKND